MTRKILSFGVTVGLSLAWLQPLPACAWGHVRGAHGAHGEAFTGQHGAAEHGAAGHGAPGYLGIDLKGVSDDEVASLHLKDTHGAEIIRVDHDGPAGKMGLREHDVVIQLNGAVVDNQDQMRHMLRDLAPGHAIALVILRDGQSMTLSSQMADRVQVERQAWEQHFGGPQAPPQALAPTAEDEGDGTIAAPAGPVAGTRYSKSFLGTFLSSPSYTGAMLEVMGPQLAGFFGVQGGSGLLVRGVAANSPAAMAGLQAGDVVVRANAHGIGTMSQWTKTIHEAKGRPVTVVVMRDRQEKTMVLTPDGKKHSMLAFPLGPGEMEKQFVARL